MYEGKNKINTCIGQDKGTGTDDFLLYSDEKQKLKRKMKGVL